MSDFSHLDKQGNATMVDVSEKKVSLRTAKARSIVVLPALVLEKLTGGDIQTKKGSVFQTAIIAGIMAAKRTGDLIPLCHPLGLENCKVDISINEKQEVVIDCVANITAKTGVEMEALVGASIAALTIYDMYKALSHDIVIKETKLIEKTGERMISSEHKPILNGLVLAGGKSVRMGYDKGAVNWHGKEQRYYVADMLKSVCNEVFISCREQQQPEIEDNYKTLPDTYVGIGPYGAILSAFKAQPDSAWLVVACDLPLLDVGALQYLIRQRDTSVIATTYESPHDGLPEPVITIWEPESYAVLLSFLEQGYTCPRKVLRNTNPHIIQAKNPDALINTNTPEDAERVKQILQQKNVSA